MQGREEMQERQGREGGEETQERQGREQVKQEKQEWESQSQEQKQEEIIVGRITKQLNIPFKTRPFVGLLRCTKKKRNAYKRFSSVVDELLSQYYIDLVPIHLRLPKMELDEKSKLNKGIIQEFYKSNQLPLGLFIEQLEQVYVTATFSFWYRSCPFFGLDKIIGKVMTVDGQCNCFLHQHLLNDFQYKDGGERAAVALNPSPHHKSFPHMVFTIDPKTSTDLDDALSIQQVGDDQYEIGVHIADVSSYLHEVHREQITRRTTSVYLPHKVFHMLPKHLVETCSLNPGVERLAFTVLIRMNLSGELLGKSRLQKYIIKSDFKLSYEQAQNLITRQVSVQEFNQSHRCDASTLDILREKLLVLAVIAEEHRKRRIVFDVFENDQLNFTLDAEKWPVDCSIEKRFRANKLVQEFMIIGNIEAARHLVERFPQEALVIHHPKPSKLAVKGFHDMFPFLDPVDFEHVGGLQSSLAQISQRTDLSQQVKKLCFFKARRAQEAANYKLYGNIEFQNSSKTIHFALGLDLYTHFTSPMRRLADIMVHEILSQLFTGSKDRKVDAAQVERLNGVRRGSKRLKRDLNQMYLCLFLHRKNCKISTTGVIASFGMDSISIYLDEFDILKEVMWRSELAVTRVSRTENKQLEVCVFRHPQHSSKDKYWMVKAHKGVRVFLDCTRNPPLRLTVELEVETDQGPEMIYWRE